MISLKRTRSAMAAASTAVSTIVVALASFTGLAQAAGIYSCVDSRGNRLTSDRPIPECLDREQRVLNKDGSEQQRVGPTLTAEERLRQDAALRKRLTEESARRDAARNDRNLVARYPAQAVHDNARASAKEPFVQALKASQRRLDDLAAQKRALDIESEFYKGKPLPVKLKQQFEHIQTSVDAQRQSVKNHQTELNRVDGLYDEELARLKRLWAGAQPGTLGPVAGTGNLPIR